MLSIRLLISEQQFDSRNKTHLFSYLLFAYTISLYNFSNCSIYQKSTFTFSAVFLND